MSETDFDTLRRHKRIDANIGVRISTIEPERDPWTGRPFFLASHETCVNLSRGGAFVKTSEPLRPGRRLLLEIQLPNGKPVEAIGRVAWSKRSLGPDLAPIETEFGPGRDESEAVGIGVEFLGGSSEEFAALDDYITEMRNDDDSATPPPAGDGA